MSNLPKLTTPNRLPNGQFGRGNSGRPVGARNRIANRVAFAILRDFENNQDDILERLHTSWLPDYARMVSRLLPRQVEAGAPDMADMSEEEVTRRLGLLRNVLEQVEAGEFSLLDMEDVLLGGDLVLQHVEACVLEAETPASEP